MIKNKKPAFIAQMLGCESVAQVSRVSGVNYRTLMHWAQTKPLVFEIICIGVCTKVQQESESLTGV